MRIHSSGHGSCRYKKQYRRKQALAAAHAVTRSCGEQLQAYKCQRCHAWHIGHVEPYRVRAERFQLTG